MKSASRKKPGTRTKPETPKKPGASKKSGSTLKAGAHRKPGGTVRPALATTETAAASRTIAPVESAVRQVLVSLRRHASPRVRQDMGTRYGIVGPSAEAALGVPMAALLAIGKAARVKDPARNHQLALALWNEGLYESRMVACMVDEPSLVTTAQMDRWCRDFDNWGICDTVCFKLFDRVPGAIGRVHTWAGWRDEYPKRAAFALLACIALHDKEEADQTFAALLPLIEHAASDQRNFVKKAVSWALRSIGRRSPSLRRSSIALAERLKAGADPAARWVGADALRDLARAKPKVWSASHQ